MSEKSILLLNRSGPYGSSNARESLDIALTCGAFEFPVRLVFLDDGVFQLMKTQTPSALEQKSLEATLAALEMYDVDQIYVCEASLASRGLGQSDLSIGAAVINRSAIRDLMGQSTSVLSF